MTDAAGGALGTQVRTRWTPMLFIGLGTALIIMDATIVNVSLPSIIRDLQIGSIDAEWVNAIYSLVFAALLIIAGRLGDRVGRRLMFVSGAVVFGIASLVAARTGDGSALVEQSAGTVIPSLAEKPGGAAVAEAAGEAFATAIRWTALTATAFIGLGLLATLKLPPDGRTPPEPAATPRPTGSRPSARGGRRPTTPSPRTRSSPDIDAGLRLTHGCG